MTEDEEIEVMGGYPRGRELEGDFELALQKVVGPEPTQEELDAVVWFLYAGDWDAPNDRVSYTSRAASDVAAALSAKPDDNYVRHYYRLCSYQNTCEGEAEPPEWLVDGLKEHGWTFYPYE